MTPSGKFQLPANPTLKHINIFKKALNWGELPPFYHMVAQSLGELEGLMTHGFDTALKRIIDPRNWNIELLGGYVAQDGKIHCENKPHLALYQLITDRGFELHAFPVVRNKEIDQYVKNNRLMEYQLWDPHDMRVLLRINQLHKFIEFYFERGDDADKALIIHAFKSVNQVIQFLRSKLNITKVDGVSIRQYYDMVEKRVDNGSDAELIAILQSGQPKL